MLIWPLSLHFTSRRRRVYRCVLSNVPANTDDLIVAPLTNIECCSVRQKFHDDSFLAPWTMLAEYRCSGSDSLGEFQWRVHCSLESSQITCNSYCWLEEIVEKSWCLRRWDSSSAVESSYHGNQIPKNNQDRASLFCSLIFFFAFCNWSYLQDQFWRYIADSPKMGCFVYTFYQCSHMGTFVSISKKFHRRWNKTKTYPWLLQGAKSLPIPTYLVISP